MFPSFRLFPDLDHGLEWSEHSLLSALPGQIDGEAPSLDEQLKDTWPQEVSITRLRSYLEAQRFEKGSYVIRQNGVSESIYFIESGRVTARLEFDDGRFLRLRSMGPGTVVGEVGMFSGGRRMAAVVTEADCVVYRLSAEALKRMRCDDPTLALAFLDFLIRVLAERLTTTGNMVRSLQEQGKQRPNDSGSR
jgi:SulP family sulfate permease